MNETPRNEPEGPPDFGGKPGEPVPTVDPEDVKTVWQIHSEIQARHPGAATGIAVLQRACKPSADIQAVSYRTWLIWLMTQIASERFAPFTRDGEPDDAVFRAVARVPAEWMGVGIVRQGPPFDVNELLQLCAEEMKP